MKLTEHTLKGKTLFIESGWTDDVRKIFADKARLDQVGSMERSSVGGIVYTVRDMGLNVVSETHTVWQAVHAALDKWGAA